MRNAVTTLGRLALGIVLAGAVYFFVSGVALAKKPPPPPPPNPCGCAEVIVLPNGSVCTLQGCGSDCVYSCTLP